MVNVHFIKLCQVTLLHIIKVAITGNMKPDIKTKGAKVTVQAVSQRGLGVSQPFDTPYFRFREPTF